MPKKPSYGNESITSLKGADRVRLRPAVIFGSDGLEGCEHAFFEILSNSIDEAREGFGDQIWVRRYRDHSLEVEDFGRGIPLDFNPKEDRYNWELVYCELYAGGKYQTNQGVNYEYSLGLNGLGACATQYASEWFDVTVMREGYRYALHFEAGENQGGLHKEATRFKRTGTRQRFKPDRAVFTEIEIPLSYFEETLKRQAVINAGVRFLFEDEVTGQSREYYYANGVEDYIRELDADKGLLRDPLVFTSQGQGRDREDKPLYKVKATVALTFNNELHATEYYHNSSYLEHGGSPDRAVRLALTSEFDRQAKALNKYKANESKLVFADIQDSLLIIINSFSTQTSYENQTKKAINNRYIQEFLTDLIKTQLEIWFIENREVAEKVLDQVLINKRSRESAEKQRLNVRKKLMGSVDITNRVKKFVDCRSKQIEQRELYIVEGDSALGSCKLGRDAEFQAIIAVRGKILNCLKADLGAIFKNEIITNLIKVLGCGVELNSKQNKEIGHFDLNALRWSKIIICTDADVDGYQIRTLILAMFYRLLPTLLSEGRVYIAETPLFELTIQQGKKTQTAFAFDEREKEALLSRHKGSKITLQRSKGLGENEPEMMWETTMNPETRRLIQVLPDAVEAMQARFDCLLGDNLAARKAFIEAHGHEYLDQLDIG